jgi:hypothetical protein
MTRPHALPVARTSFIGREEIVAEVASDHVAAIRAKLGVPSRAAASALAVRGGLLSS